MNRSEPLAHALEAVARHAEAWRKTVRERRAVPEQDVGELRRRLEAYTFDAPRELNGVVDDVSELLERWTVHTTHPGYFGLFNANVHDASVVADALTAAYNPQVGLWSHAPAANEIERHVLRLFTRAFGMDPLTATANFTTGGSEANFSALAAALSRAFPEISARGVRALPGDPVFYVSQDAHHSLEKSAHLLGLGRSAVRWVGTDEGYRMSPEALREAIRGDREAGHLPFLVVGTAGTTTLGSVDPLTAVSQVCREEGLWYHVDAAWGGGAVLSSKLRTHLAGIEHADSVTCDAHKWLSVSMGAGMLFCRHPEALQSAFTVNAPYVTASISGSSEPYNSTLQWSRRFIGLKLFMTLAHLGLEGTVAAIEHQAEMGRLLRSTLEKNGWTPVNSSPFPLVVFTHPRIQDGSVSVGDMVSRLYDRGRVWVSESRLPSGEATLRACICNYQTDDRDIRILGEELALALEA